LIINGDDFGQSLAVNRAIIAAHQRGVLTSASLMINEPAADDAIERALQTPTLAVGLHLSTVLGRARLRPDEIPAIVGLNGQFSRSPVRAGLNYFFNPRARRDLKREVRAQFEAFAATGLPFSHVDGHNHLHMHPVVFAELIDLCEEFGVKRIRVINGDAQVHSAITGELGPGEVVISRIFTLLARWCHQRLVGRGFVVPEVVHGLFGSGSINETYLLDLLPRIRGVAKGTEIYLHPLSSDASDAERNENPGGINELDALLSATVRARIESLGFRLATYSSL